jgi:asparagine N-glycosylation enzyme membrane subunit Stt3
MDKYREDELVLCIKNEFEEQDYHVGETYTIKGVSMVDGNVIYSVIDEDGVLRHTMDKFMSFNPPKMYVKTPVQELDFRFANTENYIAWCKRR